MLVVSLLLWAGVAAAFPSPQENDDGTADPGPRITASGGGLVKEGDSLTLTYKTSDDPWDRCFWSLKKEGEEEAGAKCYFTLNPSDGTASIGKCNSDELKESLEYTGTSTNECTVQVKSVRSQKPP